MDATTINTIVGIVGAIVGIIGIVVGFIGGKNIDDAKKLVNQINAKDSATIQQAQVIHNGLDSYAVIRLSRETTQEELAKAIEKLNLLTWGDFEETSQKVEKLEEKVKDMPILTMRTEEGENGYTNLIFENKPAGSLFAVPKVSLGEIEEIATQKANEVLEQNTATDEEVAEMLNDVWG